MRKKTRSILEELNNLGKPKNDDLLIEATASNIIESSINLLNMIHRVYDQDNAAELERRFLNSIRSGDPRKFKRSISRIIEGKNNDTEWRWKHIPRYRTVWS